MARTKHIMLTSSLICLPMENTSWVYGPEIVHTASWMSQCPYGVVCIGPV